VNPTGNARRLRRKQTREEAQLWQTLRAGRFAGFKFRLQVMRKVGNNRFVPPPVEKLGKKLDRKPPTTCESE
jgi:hypothetical protein